MSAPVRAASGFSAIARPALPTRCVRWCWRYPWLRHRRLSQRGQRRPRAREVPPRTGRDQPGQAPQRNPICVNPASSAGTSTIPAARPWPAQANPGRSSGCVNPGSHANRLAGRLRGRRRCCVVAASAMSGPDPTQGPRVAILAGSAWGATRFPGPGREGPRAAGRQRADVRPRVDHAHAAPGSTRPLGIW